MTRQRQVSSRLVMPSSTCASLSITSTRTPSIVRMARQARRLDRARSGAASSPSGTSTEKTEPLPDLRAHVDRVVEQAADAPHDGEAKAIALGAAGEIGEAPELREDLVELVLGNADAGVGDLDLDEAAAPAHAEQHLALRRVAAGIGEQVLQQAPQQADIGAHAERGRHARAARGRRARPAAPISSRSDCISGRERHRAELHVHPAGFQLRDVEQDVEDVLDVDQRPVDLADIVGGAARQLAAPGSRR